MEIWNKTGINFTIPPSPAAAEPSPVISSLAIVIGGVVTIINVIVFVAAIRCSPLKQNAHFSLVVGLTVTDICSGLALFTNGIRLSFSTLNRLPGLCAFVIIVNAVALLASVTQICLICLNRYIVLSKTNLNARMFSKKNRCVFFALNWSIAIVIVLAFIDLKTINKNINVCFVQIVYGEKFKPFRYAYCFYCGVVVSCTVFFYLMALFALRKSIKQTHAQRITVATATVFPSKSKNTHVIEPNGNNQIRTIISSNPNDAETVSEHLNNVMSPPRQPPSRETLRKMVHTMTTVGFIVIALLCFTGPFIIVNLLKSESQSVILLTANVAILNSIVNPFIYCINIKTLRDKLRSMLCRIAANT